MAVICPTITAASETDYARQIDNVKGFAKRIHIDLMDGQLAPTISLEASKIWLPEGIICDVHVMFKRPLDIIEELITLKPHLIVIHKEVDVDHQQFADQLREHNIKAGLALLPETPLESIAGLAYHFEQILIFGGHLGYQGGQANLGLIDKVKEARSLYSNIEIAWDGGINDQNAKKLVHSGADVLNVGAYIQSSPDPRAAYAKIEQSLKE
jgi:ribulose-phosphate 3-epimerase